MTLASGCAPRQSSSPSIAPSAVELASARQRAEAHLARLRAGDWQGAAALTICRNGDSGDRAAQLLQRVYSACRPGPIVGTGTLIETNHLSEPYRRQIGRRIRFSYRCDDLDGIEMRWIKGDWYRVLDSC